MMFVQIKLVSIVILLVMMIPLVGCSSPQTQHNKTTNLAKHELDNGFTVLNDNDVFSFVGSLYTIDGFIGSSVLVAPRVSLTAGHCLTTGKPILSVEFGGTSYKVDYCISHKTADIGLIFLQEDVTTANPVEIYQDNTEISKYTHVIAVGYSGGKKRMSKFGTLFYYGILISEPDELQILPFGGTIWFGDSGGALLTADENGLKLMGILISFSKINKTICENSAVRVDYYKNWIDNKVNGNQQLESLFSIFNNY